MAFSVFGFEIKRKARPQDVGSVVSPALEDGAAVVSNASAYYGLVIDIEGVAKNEGDLIRRYREVSQYAECDAAVEEIVNEAVVVENNELPFSLSLDDVELSASIKKKIIAEFDEIVRLYRVSDRAHELFKQWYVDGRIYFHVILDVEKPKEGILELRPIDPRKIRKIKNIKKEKNAKGVEIINQVEEYYLYNDKGITEGTTQGVKLSPDSVIYVTSGLIDSNTNMVLSYLHKAIKPVNQLKMMEDSLVIYRISRAPERRIFYIDVGNLPKLKAEQYVNEIMNKFRNKLVYDANTGEIRDNRQHLCLAMNTKVPLLDGRTLTLEEISKEYTEKELWAYSCDPVTGKFYPGLITWAGVSNPNAEVMRITLDNGESIVCTPDHKFPVWNKNLVPAKDLVVGDSMIPLYRRTHNIAKGVQKDYEQIFENDSKEWQYTHRLVSQWKDDVGLENEFLFYEKYTGQPFNTIHHKNINRFDNSPSNLVKMNGRDHIAFHQHSSSQSGKIGGRRCYEMGTGCHNKNHPNYHEWHVNRGRVLGRTMADLGLSQQYLEAGRKVLAEKMNDAAWNEWFRDRQRSGWTKQKRDAASNHAKRNNLGARGNAAQKEMWQTEERRAKHKSMYAVEYSASIFAVVDECARNNASVKDALETLNASIDVLEQWRELNANKSLSKKQKAFDKFNRFDLDKITKQFANVNTYVKLRDQFRFHNHKIAKIEYLSERIDTGCLTIDGEGVYHNHHTFALAAGIYSQNSVMEDFWMPRREGGKGTEITTLQGGCFAMDTKVSLLDGRELSIREIENELSQGQELWTYSCDEYTGEIKPGLITWAGVTQNSAKVMRLTLDNGEEIICTPDHKFPIYGKGFVQAKDFVEGESLIPLYRDKKQISNQTKLDYEMVFDNATKKWIFTHRMVNNHVNLPLFVYEQNYNDSTVVHHKDHNRFNNSPNNLCLMSDSMVAHQSVDNGVSTNVGAEYVDQSILLHSENESLFNHRVVKIEYLEDEIEVGTLTIDEHELIHSHHTFALSCGVFTKNSNLGEIQDVEYFQNKLYKALHVPLSRLQSQQNFSLGRSAEITREEVKFNKFVERLRKKFSKLFLEALKIQLIAKEIINPEEWEKMYDYIHLEFLRDNHFAELKNTEIINNRITTLQNIDPYVGKYFSKEWVRKNVLMMTEQDITDIDKQIDKEPKEGGDDLEGLSS